jgi:hypothetical protein
VANKVQNKDMDPSLPKTYKPDSVAFRILTLDGGGAKDFYTLGVLKEIEGLLKSPLYVNSILFLAQAQALSLLH